MNGSAKRLMAVLLASVMIASAMVVVLVDEQDSSAEANTNYYYNQLEMDFSKTVYDAIVAIDDWSDLTITINDISPEDKSTIASVMDADPKSTFIGEIINKGIIAAVYDNPLVGFYISVSSPVADKSISHTPGYASISFTVNKVSTFTNDLSDYNYEMDAVVVPYRDSISALGPAAKVEAIHAHVIDVLSYDEEHANSEDPIGTEIRSAYVALCGSHAVVCEGYAKMFKVLCDACGVPCLIVTGTAGTDGKYDNHMWNYVQIDGKWYLVDCTWDDQDTMRTEYLMAGTSTEGFDGETIGQSHKPTGLNVGLVVNEPLSYYSYGDSRTQYLVTFLYEPEVDPEKVYTTQYVGEGDNVSLPTDPANSFGHHFLGWYVHDSDTEFDFATVEITSDTTIDGKWTTVDVYTLKYETDGGTVIQATRVESTDNTAKITETEPKKEGYKFIEWNTAKNGGGISFKGGEDITLVGDCTLYAVWEDTNSVTFKIDNVMGQAAEFLSKETIPGVSNFLLTIGIITTVVSLIAVLAIARK